MAASKLNSELNSKHAGVLVGELSTSIFPFFELYDLWEWQ
jgi:hypothetical protein